LCQDRNNNQIYEIIFDVTFDMDDDFLASEEFDEDVNYSGQIYFKVNFSEYGKNQDISIPEESKQIEGEDLLEKIQDSFSDLYESIESYMSLINGSYYDDYDYYNYDYDDDYNYDYNTTSYTYLTLYTSNNCTECEAIVDYFDNSELADRYDIFFYEDNIDENEYAEGFMLSVCMDENLTDCTVPILWVSGLTGSEPLTYQGYDEIMDYLSTL